MSIARWDPWTDVVSLRDAMDRLMNESVLRSRGDGAFQSNGGPPLDIHEEGDNFVVSAQLPGVSPDEVEITVLGDSLRIRGERQEQQQRGGEGKRWIVREQRYGSFERLVRLPSGVKADGADADYKDGILTITLPKAEDAKAKRVPVRAGSSQQGQEIEISAGDSSKSKHATKSDG